MTWDWILIEKNCTGCGICKDVCSYHAITMTPTMAYPETGSVRLCRLHGLRRPVSLRRAQSCPKRFHSASKNETLIRQINSPLPGFGERDWGHLAPASGA